MTDSTPIAFKRVPPRCTVCDEGPRKGLMMCDDCARAFHRAVRKDDGTQLAVLEWAARRARLFERVRWVRKNKKAANAEVRSRKAQEAAALHTGAAKRATKPQATRKRSRKAGSTK